MKFKELRQHISRFEKISIRTEKAISDEKYLGIEKVPDEYNELYVHEIGITKHEYYEVNEIYSIDYQEGEKKLLSCINIELSKEKKNTVSIKPIYEKLEDNFVDMTMSPYKYEYPSEEMVEEYKFVHMKRGVYKADPIFYLSKKELDELIQTYRDLCLYGFCREGKYEIRFASSKAGELGGEVDFWCYGDFDSFEEVAVLGRDRLFEMHRYEYDDREYEYWCVGEEIEEVQESEQPLPEKKCVMYPIFHPYVREDGMIPRIMVEGFIGDMIEPGIYLFHSQTSKFYPEIKDITGFEQWAAVINYTTDTHGFVCGEIVEYLAVDKKYFERVKQLARERGDYYYEYPKTESSKAEKEREKEREKEWLWAGEEIIPGIGTQNIRLSFKLPMVKCTTETYDYAVKCGNYLVVSRCREIKRYDMRLMTYLAVIKTVELRCGYFYEVISKIIDCEEEKYKEILTPEAYELYKEQWKLNKNILR